MERERAGHDIKREREGRREIKRERGKRQMIIRVNYVKFVLSMFRIDHPTIKTKELFQM